MRRRIRRPKQQRQEATAIGGLERAPAASWRTDDSTSSSSLFWGSDGGLPFPTLVFLSAFPLAWTGRWIWAAIAILLCLLVALCSAMDDIQQQDKLEIRYSILEPNGPQWDTMVGSNYHLLQYNSSNLLDYDRQWIRTSAGAWEVHSIKRYHFNANQEWDTTFNTLYTNIVPVYNRAIYSSWHDFDERLPDEVEFARLVGLSWVPYSKEIFTYGVNDSYIQEVQIPDSNGTMQTLKIVESDKDSYGNVILHQVFLVANGDTTFQSGEKFLIQYGANGEQLEYINQTAGPDSVYVNVWKAEYGYNSVSLAPERVDWLGASLFPNPGTGKFNLAIDYPKSEELGVQVFDLQGKLLAEEHLFHPSGNFVHSLDLTGFPPATYLVRLTMDNRSANHKLVVH